MSSVLSIKAQLGLETLKGVETVHAITDKHEVVLTSFVRSVCF